MKTRITLCRDLAGPRSTDCIEEEKTREGSQVEPCKVVMDTCDKPAAAEHVGPEAESSAVWQEMTDEACCDC